MRKVNKKKFTWDDREKVLRVIFSKLNSGEIPIYWREIDVTELKKEILGEDGDQYDSKVITEEGEEGVQDRNVGELNLEGLGDSDASSYGGQGGGLLGENAGKGLLR